MNSHKIKLNTKMHNFNKTYYKNLLNTLLKYKTKQKNFIFVSLNFYKKDLVNAIKKVPHTGDKALKIVYNRTPYDWSNKFTPDKQKFKTTASCDG